MSNLFRSGLGAATNAEGRWLAIMRAAEPAVRAYVHCVAHDESDVADLVAEASARAWLGRVDILASVVPDTLVFDHTRDACREWVAARRREVPLAPQDGAINDTEISSGDASLSVREAETRQRWVQDLLAQLSDKQRLAVDYRYRWAWPHNLIAAAIGSSEAAVRVHTHRGLRRLRRILQERSSGRL
jgi:RNA polymerase sigma factor (sigma-70 family)